MVERNRQPFQLKERWQFEVLTGLVVALLALSVTFVALPKQEKLTYDEGKLVYQGAVKSNRMTGRGKLTYDNGDYYEGDFVNGAFNGQGTFVSKKGWRYEGSFKDGKPHGKGRLVTRAKTVFEGTFKQGVYQE